MINTLKPYGQKAAPVAFKKHEELVVDETMAEPILEDEYEYPESGWVLIYEDIPVHVYGSNNDVLNAIAELMYDEEYSDDDVNAALSEVEDTGKCCGGKYKVCVVDLYL